MKALPAVILILTVYISLPMAQSASGQQLHPVEGSWLPDDYTGNGTQVDSFLKNFQGKMRLLISSYQGSKLIRTYNVNEGALKLNQAEWQSSQSVKVTAGKNEELDLTCSFRLVSGELKSAGVAVAFDFSGWTTDNYILVPAQIYGGNRFRILPIGYAPYIFDEKDRPLDMPVTTTNILHL